jgi:hypothetical protein
LSHFVHKIMPANFDDERLAVFDRFTGHAKFPSFNSLDLSLARRLLALFTYVLQDVH